jgi:hypothetical protein
LYVDVGSGHRIQATQAQQNAEPDLACHDEQAHDRRSLPDLHKHYAGGRDHYYGHQDLKAIATYLKDRPNDPRHNHRSDIRKERAALTERSD